MFSSWGHKDGLDLCLVMLFCHNRFEGFLSYFPFLCSSGFCSCSDDRRMERRSVEGIRKLRLWCLGHIWAYLIMLRGGKRTMNFYLWHTSNTFSGAEFQERILPTFYFFLKNNRGKEKFSSYDMLWKESLTVERGFKRGQNLNVKGKRAKTQNQEW